MIVNSLRWAYITVSVNIFVKIHVIVKYILVTHRRRHHEICSPVDILDATGTFESSTDIVMVYHECNELLMSIEGDDAVSAVYCAIGSCE